MVAVSLYRHRNAGDEEYGRVVFDGKHVAFQGFTNVFKSFLTRGIVGADHKRYTPADGLAYMNCLMDYFRSQGLYTNKVKQ